MLERSQAVETTLQIPGFTMDSESNGQVFLPMPGLDQYAGAQFLLASEQQELTADVGKYEDQFDFVHGQTQTIHDARLAFAISAGVCGLLFIIASIVVCREKNDSEETGLLD